MVAPAFVLLDPPRAVLERRLAARHDHFMPMNLLNSQLATLEVPTPEEGVLSFTRNALPDLLIDEIVAWLNTRPADAQ
jgi:gluconokinase